MALVTLLSLDLGNSWATFAAALTDLDPALAAGGTTGPGLSMRAFEVASHVGRYKFGKHCTRRPLHHALAVGYNHRLVSGYGGRWLLNDVECCRTSANVRLWWSLHELAAARKPLIVRRSGAELGTAPLS